MRAKAASRWRISPRRDRIRRLGRERLNVTTDSAMAKALGLTPSSLSLMLSGQTQMTAPNIAMFMASLDAPFDALFAVERIQAPSALAEAA